MKQAPLKEYIERAGIVTVEDLLRQTGASQGLLFSPIAALIKGREVFVCRLVQGQETLVSCQLLLCLRSVLVEVDNRPDAQDILDWLSDHEPATTAQMREGTGLDEQVFQTALVFLQQYLCIAPYSAKVLAVPAVPSREGGLEAGLEFRWATAELWVEGLYRPGRLRELSYCLSEVKRHLAVYFSSREINELLYR